MSKPIQITEIRVSPDSGERSIVQVPVTEKCTKLQLWKLVPIANVNQTIRDTK